MSAVVVVFALLISAVGLLGMVAPSRLIAFVETWQTRNGIYAAAGIRVALGLALYLAAPDSRAPGVARGLGIFIALAGLATPFFGLKRFRRLLEWWSARGEGFIRVWAGFAFAVGLALAWLVVP